MKGYFTIKSDGVAPNATPAKRTGEQRLALIERELRKQGIDFVEDFASDNIVIVRYGAYTDDELFDHEVMHKGEGLRIDGVVADSMETIAARCTALRDAIMLISKVRYHGIHEPETGEDYRVRAQVRVLESLNALDPSYADLQSVYESARETREVEYAY